MKKGNRDIADGEYHFPLHLRKDERKVVEDDWDDQHPCDHHLIPKQGVVRIDLHHKRAKTPDDHRNDVEV